MSIVCEASIVRAVWAHTRIIKLGFSKAFIHALKTIGQASGRRMVGMWCLRFALASLDSRCTSFVKRDLALSRVWEEREDSSDLRYSVVRTRRITCSKGVNTFLAEASFAADMQTSSSMKSSLTWPPLDWMTTAMISPASEEAHAFRDVFTVDVLPSNAFLYLNTRFSCGKFVEENGSARNAQFPTNDIIESWIGASPEEDDIAHHVHEGQLNTR